MLNVAALRAGAITLFNMMSTSRHSTDGQSIENLAAFPLVLGNHHLPGLPEFWSLPSPLYIAHFQTYSTRSQVLTMQYMLQLVAQF